MTKEKQNEGTVYDALLRIQQSLNAPKDLWNHFGQYHYRSNESILEGLKPHLLANDCILTTEDRIEQKGERYYITAIQTLHHVPSGTEFVTRASAREAEVKKGMDASQLSGAASSYARKYALNAMFIIDDNKDADDHDNREKYGHGTDKIPPNRLPNEMPTDDENVVPEFESPDEMIKGIVKILELCTTVKGVENLYWNNEAKINGLPEDKKVDLLAKFGEKKSNLKK